MGVFNKVAKIAKELTLGSVKAHPAYMAYNVVKKKKKRAGSTSRTSADVTLRKRKITLQKKANLSKKKYKGMRGMKYTKKNKPVTSTADRMQARRRRRN